MANLDPPAGGGSAFGGKPQPESNRERLLRLIDGGAEVLKAAQEEREIPLAPKPLPSAKTASPNLGSAARLIASWRAKVPLSDRDVLRLLQMLVLLAAVLAVLHYGVEALKTLHPEKNAPTAALPAAEPADRSGVGLRLVGVDLSEPPVALLEDLQTGKTYFARKNDVVKDARIKHIEKNKVLLASRGRTVELR